MDINLSKDEIIVVLDALVEGIAFDKNADDIKEVYNKIVKQAHMEEYEMLGEFIRIRVINYNISLLLLFVYKGQ